MIRPMAKQAARLVLSSLVLLSGCKGDPGIDAIAGRTTPSPDAGPDAVLQWNEIAMQAVADDHSGTYGAARQGGPGRSARALAIVQVAVYDAVNAIDGTHRPYIPISLSPGILQKASVEAAVAQASHDTLAALFPEQRSVFDRQLRQTLTGIPPGKGRDEGSTVGGQAASHILAQRAGDGADYGEDAIYAPTGSPPLPGQHVPDPLHPDQRLLGAGWGHVQPFSTLDVTAPDVRTPPPPALTSPAYAAAFQDVQRLGGDGVISQTERTPEQTEIGLFWAYDGTKELGTPPRLYNQIARVIARQQQNTLVQNARLFALVNLALADAGIACWDSKYYYNVWRPIVGVRQAGLDGNPATNGGPRWTPLGAPASNESGTNFTPPFPSYPSGHATFGAALFRTLRHFYGTDDIAFRLKSDELSGRTTDDGGNHRPTAIRRFSRLSDAYVENARSRIYLGIHWQFDADAGIDQGLTVADRVYGQLLQPVP